MKIKRLYLYGLISFFFLQTIGCSSEQINSYQKKSTLENLSCFKTLVDPIRNRSDIQSYITSLRKVKSYKYSEPITAKGNYKLIASDVLSSYLMEYVSESCRNHFKEVNDFRGIRYISNNIIIVEVDRFIQHSLFFRFSSFKTYETHRLIFSTAKPDLKLYGFGTEREVIYKKLEDGLFYQVTHLDLPH